MTKLDLVLARIKELPPERQEMIAADLEFILKHDTAEGPYLTDEQWAELERRLTDTNKTYVPHDDLIAEFEAKYGR